MQRFLTRGPFTSRREGASSVKPLRLDKILVDLEKPKRTQEEAKGMPKRSDRKATAGCPLFQLIHLEQNGVTHKVRVGRS